MDHPILCLSSSINRSSHMATCMPSHELLCHAVAFVSCNKNKSRIFLSRYLSLTIHKFSPSRQSSCFHLNPSQLSESASKDKENANPTKTDAASSSASSATHQPLKRPRLGDSTMNLFEQLTSVFHDVIASGGSGAAAQSPLRSIYASLVDNSAAVGEKYSVIPYFRIPDRKYLPSVYIL